MPQRLSRNLVRVSLFTASIFLSFSPALYADVVDPTSALPPANSVYQVPPTCVSVVCLKNIQLSNFNTFSSAIIGGNEVTMSNLDLTANLFQNIGGVAGPFIAPITLTGQADITFFSKTSLGGVGTFSAQITSLDLSGSFVGLTGPHTIAAMLNPAMASTGETTVTLISSLPDEFRISSFFDVFAELSIDGGPFVPGPERVGVLGTPEPGYYVPIGIAFALILLRRLVKARRPAASSVVA